MESTFTIETDAFLPDEKDIYALLAKHKKLALKYSNITSNYIDSLTSHLEDYHVFHLQWTKTIFVLPSMPTKKILQAKKEIYDCAKAFRQDAFTLMQLMSVTFNINLETLDGLYELKFQKSNKQRGVLNEVWSYYLHGAECQFSNIQTGQIVEVIIINKPEFGCLDSYFFYQYISTTDRFSHLTNLFDHDYRNVAKAIDILAQEGILTIRTDLDTYRNIVAQ